MRRSFQETEAFDRLTEAGFDLLSFSIRKLSGDIFGGEGTGKRYRNIEVKFVACPVVKDAIHRSVGNVASLGFDGFRNLKGQSADSFTVNVGNVASGPALFALAGSTEAIEAADGQSRRLQLGTA